MLGRYRFTIRGKWLRRQSYKHKSEKLQETGIKNLFHAETAPEVKCECVIRVGSGGFRMVDPNPCGKHNGLKIEVPTSKFWTRPRVPMRR